jgi:hypothetical protein
MKKKVLSNLNLIFLSIIVFSLSACSRLTPPIAEASNILPWGSVDMNTSKSSSEFDIKNSFGKSLQSKLKKHHDTNSTFNILALSGGGSQGAYGCGVLEGWYDSGNMPKFDVVTGISTGSIISTFIFLGDEQIHYISDIYTSITTSDIYHYNFFKIFGGSSITSTTPLKNMIAQYITLELLEKVAQEYKKGRRLYIGTTNIDNGTLTVWDMSAIAASNQPNKLQLYRDIIYASSAMPGVFDPSYFEIHYKGTTYYQMHIDGSMSSYVFMIGMYDNWKEILNLKDDENLNLSLYVLSNRQYRYKKSHNPLHDDSAISILIAVAKNSVDLIYDRSIYRLYNACKEYDYNFYYTGIDDNITLNYLPHEFNTEEMQRLFREGYKKGIEGIEWKKKISENEIKKH